VKYNPETLSKAVIDEFLVRENEIFKELENLGTRTDEDVEWLISFSFAFSTRHHKTIPTVFESLAFAPEISERYSLPFYSLQTTKEEKIIDWPSGNNDSDFGKLGRPALARIDEIPHRLTSSAHALSILGMSVLSLELAKFMLSRGLYDQFASLQMVARELFASWRVNLKGMADKKRFAKANAVKRHVKTYRRRDEVTEYWKTHISPTLGNEKAADKLLEKFPDLSHRKLTEYVAAAKRKSTSS
jgi:hypothetical protein